MEAAILMLVDLPCIGGLPSSVPCRHKEGMKFGGGDSPRATS